MSVIGFKVGNKTEQYGYPNLDNIPAPDTTLSQSGKFPDSKTVGDKFKAITENCPNLLNPTLLPIGTIRGVNIVKDDDAIVLTGEAQSGTNGISQDISLATNTQYSIKIYSDSNKVINLQLTFIGDTTSATLVTEVNTAKAFIVPNSTTRVQLSIIPIANTIYSGDKYKISIYAGATNEPYVRYFTGVSAIDYIARSKSGLSDEYKNKIDTLWDDYESAIDAIGNPLADYQSAITALG